MSRSELRFQLIELALVLAVSMVLAAIAVPLLAESQLKAKLAEADINAESLDDFHRIYFVSSDSVGKGPQHPPIATLGRAARVWDPAPSLWADFGWSPDGHVRCSYHTEQYIFASTPAWTITAFCDLDGNGISKIQGWYGGPLTPSRKTTDYCWQQIGMKFHEPGSCY